MALSVKTSPTLTSGMRGTVRRSRGVRIYLRPKKFATTYWEGWERMSWRADKVVSGMTA